MVDPGHRCNPRTPSGIEVRADSDTNSIVPNRLAIPIHHKPWNLWLCLKDVPHLSICVPRHILQKQTRVIGIDRVCKDVAQDFW